MQEMMALAPVLLTCALLSDATRHLAVSYQKVDVQQRADSNVKNVI